MMSATRYGALCGLALAGVISCSSDAADIGSNRAPSASEGGAGGARDPGEDPGSEPERVCGDGVLDSGEECDDGNDDDTDACVSNCMSARCGDQIVQDGENCDDGNTNDFDGCPNACLDHDGCGDGILQVPEECDLGAGNSNSGACLKSCKDATCGDGFVHVGVEACDDFDEDLCTPDCRLPTCGDGLIEGLEKCDDGNTEDGDGCSSECSREG